MLEIMMGFLFGGRGRTLARPVFVWTHYAMDARWQEVKWPETAIKQSARIATFDYENQLNDDKQQNGRTQSLAQ